MAKKGKQRVSTPWLKGMNGLSEYLQLDHRTIRKHLFPKGLVPKAIIGDTAYYLKKDVDKLMMSNCNLKALNM